MVPEPCRRVVPEFVEGWSLSLVEGRSLSLVEGRVLRAGSSPNFYLLRRDLLVSRFVFFGKIFLSGRRESNKFKGGVFGTVEICFGRF